MIDIEETTRRRFSRSALPLCHQLAPGLSLSRRQPTHLLPAVFGRGARGDTGRGAGCFFGCGWELWRRKGIEKEGEEEGRRKQREVQLATRRRRIEGTSLSTLSTLSLSHSPAASRVEPARPRTAGRATEKAMVDGRKEEVGKEGRRRIRGLEVFRLRVAGLERREVKKKKLTLLPQSAVSERQHRSLFSSSQPHHSRLSPDAGPPGPPGGAAGRADGAHRRDAGPGQVRTFSFRFRFEQDRSETTAAEERRKNSRPPSFFLTTSQNPITPTPTLPACACTTRW